MYGAFPAIRKLLRLSGAGAIEKWPNAPIPLLQITPKKINSSLSGSKFLKINQ